MGLELGIDPKVLAQKLRNPPKPVKIAVNVIPAVIVVALCVFLVILPKNKQTNELRDVITKQEKDISDKQSKVANLEKLKKQTEMLKKELIEMEEAIPEQEEISTLLKQINNLTKEANLDIISWKPSTRKQMAVSMATVAHLRNVKSLSSGNPTDADLIDPTFDLVGRAGTFNYRSVFFVNRYLLGLP